jgi:hypothetical protein
MNPLLYQLSYSALQDRAFYTLSFVHQASGTGVGQLADAVV